MTFRSPSNLFHVLPFRRILVTGATGFVGRYVVEALASRSPGATIWRGAREEAGADVPLDLANADSVGAAVAAIEPDCVVHLAGEASVSAASHAAAATWRVNLGGSLALASALSAVSPTATFLFVSSAEVYGAAFLDGEVDERTLPRPTSVYAQSKFAAEQMLGSVLSPAARLIVARPTNHIGPGQGERFAIPSFARQLADSEAQRAASEIRVGNLSAERDFMDVRDVVEAYVALLGLPLLPGARETFNVSSGTVQSIQSMLDRLRAEARVSSVVLVEEARVRLNEIQTAAVSSRHIRERTGWQPRIALQESLLAVLDDWRVRAR